MSLVYACFTTDIIHEGHLNIINEAQKYGDVIIGALADEALIRFDRFPTKSMEERIAQIEKIEGVSKVIIQEEISYNKIIDTYKPDYIIHGDNWLEGPLKAI